MIKNMSRRFSATCPISYRPGSGCEQHTRNILGYIFSGYETCDSSELHDICLQTNICMSDWDEQYFEGIIERFSPQDVGDTLEDFKDVIESGDEDFHSVKEDKIGETGSNVPRSINIQLKDCPHIIFDDGVHKTKISLTPKYLEKNGLELLIGEGPERNIRLKAGNSEIYPPDKALPSDINISVTDEKESPNYDPYVNRASEDVKYIKDGPQNEVTKLGLLSLVVDNLEQQNIDRNTEDNLISFNPGRNIVKCISDYGYMLENEKAEIDISKNKDRPKLGRIQRANAEMVIAKKPDPELAKKKEIDMYKKVKKKFFKSVLEGDARLDDVKRELIDELVKKGYGTPEKEKFTNTEVQTEVHIDPAAYDDFSFSDGSDSITKRYEALRDRSGYSYSQPPPSRETKFINDETEDKNTSQEATKGQVDSDFSARTEPTMEGISDLTERNMPGALDTFVKEKEYATDDDVSDIPTKPKKTESSSSIERRSKFTETEELDQRGSRDVALSERLVRSPSLVKALQSLDEELTPLHLELTKLLMDFKSIDVPEEVQLSVAADRFPEQLSTSAQESTSARPSTSALPPIDEASTSLYPRGLNESIHNFYRASQNSAVVGDPCQCAPGTCVGYPRSSGIICQRVRRLPSTTPTAEFFREFTRPAWVNNTLRASSIFSEPEDIYGDRPFRRPPSQNSLLSNNQQVNNKHDPK